MSELPEWAKAFSQSNDFAKEQERLGQVWTFLGFEQDIPNINDWFKTTLGGHSIFVQRFEEGLRAFENTCAHRFYPLRNEEKGNGPVVCGFHQWRYDACGQAVGIPKCKQMYGKLPKELNAFLSKVELSVCGDFIFGRTGDGPSLQEWLGPGYDILSYLTQHSFLASRYEYCVKANWKFMMEISLDDYHLVAVHPSTFGRNGFLSEKSIKYFRFGSHSLFAHSANDDFLENMAQSCREHKLEPKTYTIFQFFPNLIVSLTKVKNIFGKEEWYLYIQHLESRSHNETRSFVRLFVLTAEQSSNLWHRLQSKLITPIVNKIVKYYSMRINEEDNQVCEHLQKVSHQINANMILSNQEQRVGWFEEEYAKHVLSKNDR